MFAIDVERVSKRFGPILALDDVSLKVGEGEFVSLIGPSGCGKTTLLRVIAGLEDPTIGEVLVNGDPPFVACKKHEIGVAFQTPALVPSLTAQDNVALTLRICCNGRQLDPCELLGEFGLAGFLNHYPHQLSGGMRQRVNIACALVHKPSVLLLDEPFGALDEITREQMGEWLAGVLSKSGQTVVFVTHDVDEAILLSDRVIVMSSRPGRIHEEFKIGLPKPRGRELRTKSQFIELALQVRQSLYQTMGVGDETH
jgi:NitT/TauT family transport system ATP-binding protein